MSENTSMGNVFPNFSRMSEKRAMGNVFPSFAEMNLIKHLKQIDGRTINQGFSIIVSLTAGSGQIDQNDVCHHLSKVYQLTYCHPTANESKNT